jgi:hypothetical protein
MDRISTAFDSYFLHSYTILSTATGPRSSTLTSEKLAQRWGIGLETAKNTLCVTTQKGICSTMYPVERRLHTRQAQLRYKQFSGIHGKFTLILSSDVHRPYRVTKWHKCTLMTSNSARYTQ